MKSCVAFLILLGIPLLCATCLAWEKPLAGKASYYTTAESRNLMANGKPLRDDLFTCASWFYPFGSTLEVTHGNRKVHVIVTDRGPNKRLVKQGRIVDLTITAFEKLAPHERGVIDVQVRRIK